MPRLVGQLDRALPLARDILQHEHGADDAARAIPDWSRRHVDRKLAAVAAGENRVTAAFDRVRDAKQLRGRIDDGVTIGFLREVDGLFERLALHRRRRQAGQRFRHRIEVVDAAALIRRDDGVAD